MKKTLLALAITSLLALPLCATAGDQRPGDKAAMQQKEAQMKQYEQQQKAAQEQAEAEAQAAEQQAEEAEEQAEEENPE